MVNRAFGLIGSNPLSMDGQQVVTETLFSGHHRVYERGKGMGTRIVRSTCKSCHGGCGVLITVEDGTITYIEGNPEHPNNRGTMCAKGLASIQHVHNRNRLAYPLKRMGKRGEGQWKVVTWDEALDTITEKMKEAIQHNGPNSVAIGQGTTRGYTRYTTRFVNSIGSGQRLTPGYVCFLPRVFLYQATFGGRLYCDFHGWGGEYPKTTIFWAKQAEWINNNGELSNNVVQSLENTKNLILVDPRVTSLTGRAKIWLNTRHGTDAALALGMLHVIINEGLYDHDFVTQWCYGFDQLRERVQEYSPRRVSEITWLPEEKIIQAARIFAVDTPGTIMIGSPLEAQTNATQTLRAIMCLSAVTGNVERPGSSVQWIPPATGNIQAAFGSEIEIPEESIRTLAGADKYRLTCSGKGCCHPDTIFKELNQGTSPVKVIYFAGSNPVCIYANTREVLSALQKLDFLAVADLFMSPTAEYADIVLPVAHWLEMNDVGDMPAGFVVSAVNKAVDPPGQAWPDSKIFNELGRRMAPQHWFKDEEEMLDYQLRKAGITWKEFSQIGHLARTGEEQTYYKHRTDYFRKGGGFKTPTGKVELYSSVLEKLGYDPLPFYVEPEESPYSTPELCNEFPMILSTGGRLPYYFNGQYRQIPWLRELQPYPLAQIHPDTAKKHGIEEGDWIWIETPRGRIKQKAKVYAGVDPRSVVAQASWWYPELPGPLHGILESSANVLTSNETFDPATGAPNFRALLCKIYKAKEKE